MERTLEEMRALYEDFMEDNTPSTTESTNASANTGAATGPRPGGLFARALLSQPDPAVLRFQRNVSLGLMRLRNMPPSPEPDATETFFRECVSLTSQAAAAGDHVVVFYSDDLRAITGSDAFTWQQILLMNIAVYTVLSTNPTTFVATFRCVFWQPQSAPEVTWPTSLPLHPQPSPVRPHRLTLTTTGLTHFLEELSTTVPTQRQAPETGATDPSTASSSSTTATAAPQPHQSRHEPQHEPTDAFAPVTDYAEDALHWLSEQRNLPSTFTDDGGFVVARAQSLSRNKIHETTPFRVLTGDTDRVNKIFKAAGTGNDVFAYSEPILTRGCTAIWRENLHILHRGYLPPGALLHPPLSVLAWYAHRQHLKDLPLQIILFRWTELHVATTTSPRLAHLLPSDRIATLPDNQLSSWQDFVLTLHGLELTYGFYLGPSYAVCFNKIYTVVQQSQLGALLSALYLEAWLLTILAFISDAAQAPTTHIVASNPIAYPTPFMTRGFTAAQWCDLIESEFHSRIPLLTLSHSDSFVRSLTFPMRIDIPAPMGKFARPGAAPGKNTPQTNPAAKTPANETAAADKAPKKPASAKQKKATATPIADPATSSKKPRTPATASGTDAIRMCLHSLCAHYKIPVRGKEGSTPFVPMKCSDACKYMHVADLPASATRTALQPQVMRTATKILDEANVQKFQDCFLKDSRLPQ